MNPYWKAVLDTSAYYISMLRLSCALFFQTSNQI